MLTLTYAPQQALLAETPPTGSGWIHELKLDGYRMGLAIDGDAVQMISRRGNSYTAEYAEIIEAARTLAVSQALLDGELVVLDERGVANFQRLQQLGQSRRGLTYFAFDLLALNGERLDALPLRERKARLETLVAQANSPLLRYSMHFDAAGPLVFQHACALGAEGIVSKRLDAPYRAGVRSAEWQKTKCVKRQEFVVGGFTDPEGSRSGVGSLLIGYYEAEQLRFAGKVGNGKGWTVDFSSELRRHLDTIECERSPFNPRPPGWLGRNAHWVEPEHIVDVQFAEWTEGGHVRHPTLLGFRTDKIPRDVVREIAENVPTRTSSASAQARTTRVNERKVAASSAAVETSGVPVFGALQLRAADVAEIYRDLADVVLPHVANRPLTLVRAHEPIIRDDALRTQADFIHHTAEDQSFVSNAVPRVRIQEQKKVGEYLFIDSTQALLALIASGAVEWHTWNALVDDVEWPDRIIFDIDPGPDVPWSHVVGAARAIRRALDAYELESWLKTTGGRGLHVVVPFDREYSWEGVFAFSKQIATAVAASDPQSYTLVFDKDARHGRVLLDYKRNYRTAIAVAAFSTRAKPQASLSVPIAWSELSRLKSSDHWTLANIRARLSRQRVDPWAGYWRASQKLPIDSGGDDA